MHVLNFLFMLPSHFVHIKIQQNVQLVCQTYFLRDVENKPGRVVYSYTICTCTVTQNCPTIGTINNKVLYGTQIY